MMPHQKHRTTTLQTPLMLKWKIYHINYERRDRPCVVYGFQCFDEHQHGPSASTTLGQPPRRPRL